MTYSEQVSAELDAARHPHQLTVFPNVGHTFGSLNCLIGANYCPPINRMSSIAWDSDAYVTASRVTFVQTVAFLKSLANEKPIGLPTSVPRPTTLPPANDVAPIPTPMGAPGTVILRDTLNDPGTGTLPDGSDEPNRYTRGYAGGEYVITLPALSTLTGDLSDQAETVLAGKYGDTLLAVSARLVTQVMTST